MTSLAATATRQVQWDVGPGLIALMYASMGVALAVFAWGVWRLARVWLIGEPGPPAERRARLRRLAVEVLGHTRLLRERLAGATHAALAAGLAVLFAATVVVFVDHDLGVRIMRGDFYLGFQSLAVDLFGLVALAAAAYLAWRRFVAPPARLGASRPGDALLLGALLAILVTGFLLEGSRIAATADPYGPWSPVGYAVARALEGLGASVASLRELHAGLWAFHVLLWHASLASLPFTRFAHAFVGPLNVYLSGPRGPGVPPPVDFEADPPRLGIASALDLTRRQLVSLDACVECGRCQAVCPAFGAGKPLSPRQVVLDLRDHVREHGRTLRAARAAGPERRAELLAGLPPLAGGAVPEEALWACTTCRACELACPVGVEHVPMILGLRRHLAMEQAALPQRLADAVGSLEARGHPYTGAAAAREEWWEGLPVRRLGALESGERVELLYWVGCAAAFDRRVQRVARALARVLDAAGVRFAVLGAEERCCGDPARRTGNELHYELLARENRRTLERHGVARIVTHCPHCLQTLGQDYGLGGRVEVVHHSALLRSLLDEGRLRLAAPVAERVTFHDPCYLGRYAGEVEAPRALLDSLGAARVEMPRSGERSSCCGAGGGHAFFDDGAGERINRGRAREALETGATTLCTACPFCLGMMEDGLRAERAEGDPEQRTLDLAELVAEALGRPTPSTPRGKLARFGQRRARGERR